MVACVRAHVTDRYFGFCNVSLEHFSMPTRFLSISCLEIVSVETTPLVLGDNLSTIDCAMGITQVTVALDETLEFLWVENLSLIYPILRLFYEEHSFPFSHGGTVMRE